ncbi:hypothetical protein LINPERHAP1_LOCUS3699, partial [Linum perenne]
PSNSFISWLAVQGRLSTKDRLLGWGLSVNPNCVLCSGRIDRVNSDDGVQLLSQFSNVACSKSARSLLAQAAWTVVVSSIWREKCAR